MISYDYEPVYSLGTMLGIFRIEGFLKLMDAVEAMGMDAMSAGVALAWATEAFERGLIGEEETLGLELRWGDHETYMRAVELIARPPNEFYEALARGVAHASSKYGGEDFALSFGSNEMPGYHTGPLCHVGYLTGARHSHLDGAGYSLDQKMLAADEISPAEESAEALLREEAWRQILSSLVVCFFSRGIYDKGTVLKALEVNGIRLDGGDLDRIGLEILRNKLDFKLREGFDPGKLAVPRRVLETETPLGKIDEAYLRRAVDHFFELLRADADAEA